MNLNPFRPVYYHARQELRPPKLEYIAGVWILADTYEFEGHGYTIVVPEGFRFDLASVPRFLWWFIAPFELSIVAPLIHDYLYEHRGVLSYQSSPRRLSRRQVDRLFFRIMLQEKVGVWRSFVAYAAVRVFGGIGGWTLI